MQHEATTSWHLSGDMPSGHYSRVYETRFDGGAVVTGAPSSAFVPLQWTDETAVDPEEMFVAAISSCHMLWFLDFARRKGLTALTYDDPAVGVMTKNDTGALWISKVTLRPKITWEGQAPDAATVAALHDKAHHACFIANSAKTEIVLETI